ncbi:MAG: TRAP transporter TatT component family protein [Syntrophobacterales bacterium]|jgi:fructose-specific component phosphotransferase system IIB-like protein
MSFTREGLVLLWSLSFFLASGGCAPTKPARVSAVAYTAKDVFIAAAKQSDPTIVRAGTPAYLMLVDGLIEAYPDNSELLTAGCRAYTAYASSFVEDTDPDKAAALYAKAKGYGFRALSKKQDFQQAVTGQVDDFVAFLKQYNERDVAPLFWTASAWMKWISLNIDNVEALADMAMLEATMQRTLELDDSFYHGSPHLLMAVYLAARPDVIGGNTTKAKEHFDKAFSLGADKLLSAKVLFARYYAVRLRDRVLFVKTLQGVIDAPVDEVPELTLANTLAKEKAREMLEKVDDYFGEFPQTGQ